ncbi:hypothetical protein DL93DRAFT_2161220 [Clavulina sp. PMI_390]|nr:hypothetical protein DL93DRAFT_2161220 [Clavulina sp. PMI_390]
MSHQSFFEIDVGDIVLINAPEAVYHSSKLKPGRWHRLVISWTPLDSKNQTKRVTGRVKPTGNPNNLRCIWPNPSAGSAPPGPIGVDRHLYFLMGFLNGYWHHCLQMPTTTGLLAVSLENNIPALPCYIGLLELLYALGNTAAHASRSTVAPPTLPPSPLLPVDAALAVKAAAAMVSPHEQPPGMDAINQATGMADQVTQLATTITTGFPTLLTTLESFMKIGSLVSQVHPIATAAWSIVNVAYQVIEANAALDAREWHVTQH